jgi:hypothetical protein
MSLEKLLHCFSESHLLFLMMMMTVTIVFTHILPTCQFPLELALFLPVSGLKRQPNACFKQGLKFQEPVFQYQGDATFSIS